MEAPLRHSHLMGILFRLIEVLVAAGDQRWSGSLARIGARLATTDPATAHDVVRELLGLYGGSGGFNDVVLQDRDGPLASNAELDALRSDLFEEARNLLA